MIIDRSRVGGIKRALFAFIAGLFIAASSSVALADTYAYIANYSGGSFGLIDLNTGVVTSIGYNSSTGAPPGQGLSGLGELANGQVFTVIRSDTTDTLYTVNTSTGALASVGSASNLPSAYYDFGSTQNGLYALANENGVGGVLYSINPSTGAATLIGDTGISFFGWYSLSTSVDSSTLYFADGNNLYTINTATGAATIVGPLSGTYGSIEMGALLLEGTTLYGGANYTTATNPTVDTINTSTGAATTGPQASPYAVFDGLAPYTPTSTVPEPVTLLFLAPSLLGLAALKRRFWR